MKRWIGYAVTCMPIAALIGLFATTTCAQTAHNKQFWRAIAEKKYAVPEGENAFALAKELGRHFKSPDSEMRDALAYTILYVWIVREKRFSTEELLTLEEERRGNLKAGIGKSGKDSVFGRAFSVLGLSMLGERELKTPFLGEARYRTLLEAALNYLRDERDLRGFDKKKGWIHATAHTADLLAALAENPLFTKQDQANVLKAIGERLSSAHEIFSYGEQDRLANVVAVIAARKDFDLAGFQGWLAAMDAADFSIWKESPPNLAGLQGFENDTYFLSAFVTHMEQRERTSAAEEAKKAVLESFKSR